MTKFCSSCSA